MESSSGASQTLEEEVIDAKLKLKAAESSGNDGLITARLTRLNMLEARLERQQQPPGIASIEVPVHIRLRKKGTKTESKLSIFRPYAIETLVTFLEERNDALKLEDFKLLNDNGEVLNQFLFIRLVEGCAATQCPLLIEWESSSVACSSLSIEGGERLLGILDDMKKCEKTAPSEALDLAKPVPELLAKAFPKEDGSSWTVGELIDHFGLDMFFRQRVSDLVDSNKEYTRREFISPVLFCASLLVEGILVIAEKELRGQLSHGVVDYVLEYLGVSIICIEAKLFEQLLEHRGQLYGEVRAARDVLKSKVLGKRKFDNISNLSTSEEDYLTNLKKMPTMGILSNGHHFYTYQYKEEPLELVQFGRLSLAANMGTPECTFEGIRDSMIPIVSHLVALLKAQIAAANTYLPEGYKKNRGRKTMRK